MLAFVLLFVILSTQFLAIVALARNKYSKTGWYHYAAITAFDIWAITNIAAEQYIGDVSVNATFNQLAFMFAFLGAAFTALFARSYAEVFIKAKRSVAVKILSVLAIISGAYFAYSPAVAGVVEQTQNGDLLFVQGDFVWVIAIVFVSLIVLAIRYLLVRVRYGTYTQKNQARFIIFGIAVTTTVAIITNLLIPAISPGFSNGGYTVAILLGLFVIPTSYALIKDRLIDVRPIAARSTALFFLFTTLGSAYVLVLLWLNTTFISDYDVTPDILVLYALIMVVLGFVIHPLYKTYYRAMGKVFLRNVYEPQSVINELNNVLVANLKLQGLMPQLQRVIRDNVGTRYTLVQLHPHGKLFHQGIARVMAKEELAHVELEANRLFRKGFWVVSLRELVERPDNYYMVQLMQKHRLSVIAPIKQGSHRLATAYLSVKKSELPYTAQDIEIITIILNQAGLAIQNALLFEELSSLNASLKDRVAVATKDLQKTNAQLKTVDKAKDDFISIASHQLRTPLTTLKGYLSMLLEGGLGKITTKQRDVIQLSFDSSQRMSYVVSDLLNLTRLRTGTFTLNLKSTNLADTVESELGYLKEQIKFKQLQVTYAKPVTVPEILLDDTKIRQVIKNFIYNALFYTPAGGNVTVEVRTEAKNLIFTVKDSGIGVPKTDQKHLFTQFYRAQNAKDVRPDGTGVGLYISKAVIEAHKGHIIFESTEGKGSTFGFSLPIN